MKLDRFKFARLAAWIAARSREELTQQDIGELDFMTEIDVEPVALPLKLDAIDGLMKYMVGGTHKIDAIRFHRALTGMSLKDSKDAVEKYWATHYSIGDLKQKLKDARLSDDIEYHTIERFINSL